MLKCRNLLLAFLTAVSLLGMPVTGEEIPPDEPHGEPVEEAVPADEETPPEETPAEEPTGAGQEEGENGEPAPSQEPEPGDPEPKTEEQPEEETPEEPEEKPESEPEETPEVTASEEVSSANEEVIDLNETLAHASARLNADTSLFQKGPSLRNTRALAQIQTDYGQLVSKGRVAQFDSMITPGAYEFVSMFFMNDRVCYCVEPDVQVSLSNGYGVNFSGHTWENLDESTRVLLKRIAWFGYGFPQIGTSKEAYVATQLLIWKVVAPDIYEQINSTLHMCPEPSFEYKACTESRAVMDETMARIENLVSSYDTVPSFADSWHQARSHSLEWGETLTLTDTRGVLPWFNEYSEEDHKGIHIRVEDSRMLVDIDDLYYDGWNTASGKPLTFKRKADQWENMLNGLLLYEAGDEQKLMAASGMDPTPQYQLSFKLKTGDIQVRKMDEYHTSGSFAAGTEFYAGWYEDPETQYQKTGSNDRNWTEYHDADRVTKNDEDGSSNIRDTTRMYYPIMTEDGSAIRRFAVGTDGTLRISGFLPANKKWWIREVGASQSFDSDERPWSAETGAPGTTRTVSFVNKLRDVTLELVKQDEEDPVTKINDAGFIVYEIGDLDLRKDPTDYGTEVNLQRMRTPSLTYRQLKEHCDGKEGDSFLFNGYLYTLEEITEKQYILHAVKSSEYHPGDTDCFSRYQLSEQPSVGQTVETRTVASMHGTFDEADDTAQERKAEITEIRSEDGDVIVHLCETEEKANVLIREDTEPSYETFEQAAKEQNVPLCRGSRLTVDRRVYTLKSVNTGSLIASPDREYDIHLSDPVPEWSDIPDARNLSTGDTFTLRYPYSEDGESFVEKEAEFTVLQNGPRSMKLQSGDTVMTVQAPEWISYEDIPETISKEEQLIVQAVKNPVYYVADSRGNRYRIADSGTEVLQRVSDTEGGDPALDAKPEDLSYRELIGGEEIEGGACLDPFAVKGCPVGLTRTKQLPRVDTLPYEGPQFEAFSEEEREEGAVVEKDGIRYQIKEADAVSLLVSYAVDGMEYLAELVSGTETKQATHTSLLDVTFTIEERDEKEIDVNWETLKVPDNSLASKSSLHLYAYGEEETQGDLNWDMVSGSLAQGRTFQDENGVTYTVLYADPNNHKAVVESFRGRYEVTPEYVKRVMPVTWQIYTDLEEAQGAVYHPGDRLAVPYEQNLVEGDVFERDGIRYTVQALDYVDDGRGTETLRSGTAYRRKLNYAWEADAPYEADELQEAKDAREEETADSYRLTLLKDDEGNVQASYITEELTDHASHDPYEEQEPSFRVEVDRPGTLLYEDAEQARYAKKEAGMHVRLHDTLYRIKELKEDSVTVTDEGGAVHTITSEAQEKDPFTLEEFNEAPIEWVSGDEIRIKDGKYRIVSVNSQEKKGTVLKLKNLSNKSVETLEEYPDPDTYETETLTFYRTGNSYKLSLSAGEWGFRLRRDNPHIRLNQEDGVWTLSSDANATEVLETLDADGDPIASRKIIFSTTEPEGDVTALPVFAGITGHQYVRLVDPDNHNMPIPGKQLTLYREETLKTPVRTYVSDSYGTADISELEPGTYWYADPVNESVHSVTVTGRNHAEGQLHVDGLKWGRTYLAYEETLPEGYDYGTSEVTHAFRMNAAARTNTIQATLENRLRRIAVKVYKVDQEDHRIPLNNAWFTAEDVTDADTVIDQKLSSTNKAKVTIADIPADTQAGDVISVWPTRTDGKKHVWRVEKVLPQEVILSMLEDGAFRKEFHIPVKGTSVTAPMQYSDIVRSLGVPKRGAVFEQMEKEPADSIHRYQVVQVETDAAEDVFGQRSAKRRITLCRLYDLDDSSKTMITVRAVQSEETFGSQALGEYVTGGILMRSTEEGQSMPVSFADAEQAGIREPGDTMKQTMPHTAPMPDYAGVQKALAEGKETLEYGAETWQIRKGSTDAEVLVQIHGQEFALRETTIPGAVSWMEEETLTAQTTELNGDRLSAVVLRDSKGDSWYVSEEQNPQNVTVGKAGEHVSVSDGEKEVFDGYTGADGRILFADLAEGDYSVTMGNVTSPAHVEKGMILLPEVRYGHTVKICETRSPLGYLIGNACAVVTPKAPYTVDTVTNTRTNARLVTRRKELRKIVILRRTGETS